MYQIQMQFIPGTDSIWVIQLYPTDPIYQYDNIDDANNQLTILQAADDTGRIYKVVQI
jgi:hypothetical protein